MYRYRFLIYSNSIAVLLALALNAHGLVGQENTESENVEVPKVSLAQFVFDMSDRFGTDEGIKAWNQYKDSDKFSFRSADFLNSSLVLLQRNKVKEAIAVLENCRSKDGSIRESFVWEYTLQFLTQGSESAAQWLDTNRSKEDLWLDKSELNLAGSAFFDLGNIKEARALAEIFAAEFPKTPNAHERIAEVLLAEGKRDEAFQKYRDRLALDENQTSFFHLAAAAPTTYNPTKLPADVTQLYRAHGNPDSEQVFVFVQGGPCPYFGVYQPAPLSLLPNQKDILRVEVTESQIINPSILAAEPPMSEQQALFEHHQSAEILHRVVKNFKDQGKKVYVIGHSYGCHIGIEYLCSKPNLADRIVLMGSDLDEDLRNYPDELVGTGRIIRWIDGIEPYEREFFGDFGVKPLLEENLNRIFENTGSLVSYHGKRRGTERLKGRDLSNVVFVYGKFDESNGRTKPYELKFWRDHGAQTVESYGDHHSMLSPAHMTNFYHHLVNNAPLKQSVASFISDKTDELGTAGAAIELYHSKKNSGQFHAVVESEINTLGYQLVAQSKLADAIDVFKFNALMFPHSWNTHDSLGESLLSDGKTQQAAEHYERSLEINPGNTFGIAAMRQIKSLQNQPKNDAPEHEYTKGVNEVVKQCMRDQHLPGMAVVVVHKGKTIFKKGYGVANVETGSTVDVDKTLFRIGSISKALTLLTLTRLVDQGLVAMDDDVSKYFDGIDNRGNFRNPVTIRNLLTHTSGFDQIGGRDRQVYQFGSSLAERKRLRPELADYLKSNRLRRVTPAGQYFRYDTYGSSLAGAIIERVVQRPYSEAMIKEMFEPLGMHGSFVEVPADRFSELATGYGFRGGAYVAQPYEVFATTPASSIDATAADMGRLMEALTSDGANANGRFLSKKQAAKVLAPQYRSHPEFVGTTHGMFESYTSSANGFQKHVRTVGHGGSMRGFIASLTIIPEAQTGIFIVTNRAPESGGGRVQFGPIVDQVIENLPSIPDRVAHDVPKRHSEADLSEYVGNYYYGVFCHSADAEDISNGAWQRPRATIVSANEGSIIINDESYLPRGEDVFVREDGGRLVYFGRNENGQINFFLYSTSADTFEKLTD